MIKSEPDTDNELLNAIAEAVKGEAERSEKMAELKKAVEVSAVSTRERNDFQVGGRKDGLVAKMEEMRLKHGCQTCVSQNKRCTHCFFCEEGGHRMAFCPKYQELLHRNGVQTNGQGTTNGNVPAANGMLNASNGLPLVNGNRIGNNGSPGNC